MGLFDLIYVKRCCICNEIIPEGAVCPECDKLLKGMINIRKRSIEVDGRTVEGIYMLDYHDSSVKKFIFALKRTGNKELFKYASQMFCMLVPDGFCGVVTNVPRRKVNCREYGFDHMAEICKRMPNLVWKRVKYIPLVKRKGFSKDQKNLSAKERMNNAAGKFKVKKKNIRQDILLIDDVVTTGNTVSSCILELVKKNPDAHVQAVFIAS